MTLIQSEPKKIYIGAEPSRLPAEYQEVEYIENTASCYINTGVTYDTTNRVFQIKYGLPVGGGLTLFGNFPSWSESVKHTRYSKLTDGTLERDCYAGHGYGRISYAGATTGIDELELGNNYIKDIPTDTVLVSGTAGTYTNSNDTIKIFYRDGGPNNGYATYKLYYFKIIDNGSPIRDFVPCYRKADSVIGLYDLVNDVFYTNAGTGTFAKGTNIGGEKEIKRIMMRPNGVEKQIRPSKRKRPSGILGGYWKLNGDMSDSSGNGHNGSGTANYTTGHKAGTQAYNASSTSYYVSVPNSAELYPLNGESFSLGFWTKPSYAYGVATTAGVISMTQNIDSRKGWSIHNDGNSKNWQLRTNSGSLQQTQMSGLTWSANEWFHFVITYDGTTVKYFKNGVQVGSFTRTVGNCDTTYPLTIGYASTWSASAQAVMQEVFYMKNYCLSQSEITDIYNLT